MRPNISNTHALPWSLIIFEWPDGSGKSTQIKTLKKLLEKEGKIVTVSEWKTAPVISSFMRQNEGLKKFDDRILPETSLFVQAADFLYRIEREVVPALKQWHVVLLDRGIHTLIVRGLMIGMSDTQLREGLLWWRNTIYRELFDNAHTIYFTVSLEESLNRLQKRTLEEQREILGKNYNKKRIDGTLLALQFINSMVYAPDGKKLTRNDKKLFINQTQNQIIETYMRVFEDESQKYTQIDTNQPRTAIASILKKYVIDMLF